MQAKLKILLCALVVLGLAVSQARAAVDGFVVGVKKSTAAQYGTNQLLGQIKLTATVDPESSHIPANFPISINYDDLALYGPIFLLCEDGGQDASAWWDSGAKCRDAFDVSFSDTDEDDKNDTVVISLDLDPDTGNPEDIPPNGASAGVNLVVLGVRADVSGLDDGDTISASVASGTGEFASFTAGIGGTSGTVSTVKAGLVVDALAAGHSLICVDSDDTDTNPQPSITLKEGFGTAWATETSENITVASSVTAGGIDGAIEVNNPALKVVGAAIGATMLRIQVSDLPDGVSLEWPEEVIHTYDDDDDEETDEVTGAVLELDDDSSDEDTAIYVFVGGDDQDSVNTFEIKPTTKVDISEVGAGGSSDVEVQLYPEPNDDNDKLAYDHPFITHEDGGRFLAVTDCVTYLLFPFVTCGTQGWTTGFAVSNTSADEGIFAIGDGAEPQDGSLTVWGFPKSVKNADGSSQSVPDSTMAVVSPNLASGDSIMFSCAEAGLVGLDGYAIARADFQHAHGGAFILGQFNPGHLFDVAHGYLALVIPDPAVGGLGRSADSTTGEGLSQ